MLDYLMLLLLLLLIVFIRYIQLTKEVYIVFDKTESEIVFIRTLIAERKKYYVMIAFV